MPSLPDKGAGGVLRKLADWLFAHPRVGSYPQWLLLVACVFYTATQLRLSTDRGDLVSQHERYRRTFLDVKEEFGLRDLLVVVVESESQDKNRRFLEQLAVRLEDENHLIRSVHFKGDLKRMGPKAMLFLSEEELAAFHHNLESNRDLIRVFSQANQLNAVFELVNRQFRQLRASPRGATGEVDLVRAVPTLRRLMDLASESVLESETAPVPGVSVLFGAEQGGERQGGYLTFAGGRIHVLTAEAATPELEATAIHRLRELLHETQVGIPGINVGLTGESVLRYDEMEQARKDTLLATGIALGLTAVILIWFYHEIRRPMLATLCLLVGIGYTLGFATFTVGRLNLLSITLVPILIGLAIDFGVHLISRYDEELRIGCSSRVAMQKAMGFTGIGILTSALTTAGAFFTMMLTDLRGIREMGWIAGTGLLVSVVPMLTLLPLLLVGGKRGSLHPRRAEAAPRRESTLLESLACCARKHRPTRGHHARRTRLEQLMLDRSWTVLGGAAAMTLFTFLHLPKVHFDYNLQNLQTRGLPAVEMERKLIRTGSQSVLSCSVVADSLPEAAALEREILRLPSVAGVTSLVTFLTEDQETKLAWVRAIKREIARIGLPDPDFRPIHLRNLEQTLFFMQTYVDRAIEKLPLMETGSALEKPLLELRASVSRLRALAAQGSPETAARLTLFQQGLFQDLRETMLAIHQQNDRDRLRWEDVPPFFRDRFRSPEGRFRLQVHSRDNLWQRDKQETFVRELRTLDPDVTGSPVQFYETTSRLMHSFQEAAGYALAIVAVLVFLHFRRWDATLLALTPLLLGYGWMLGLMGWLGIPLNPINVASLALVVGIGVTNGVHVLNRFVEEKKPVILTRSTGKAVVVSALTTIAGFGSLLVARHQGIASLGAVMAIGTAACMLASLAVLPTVLNLLGRKGWNLASRRSSGSFAGRGQTGR
jgi:uncharacterized protein